MKMVLKMYDTAEEKVVEMATEVMLNDVITLAMEYVKINYNVLFLLVLKAVYDVLKKKSLLV